jgi:two-component system response regulator PilR (NtrC family)
MVARVGRVLVVDDEQSLRDVLEVLIAKAGHAVRTVRSVDEAKQIISSQELDLVITDLRLEPGGDGLDVVRAARALYTPPEVIVMTAYGTRDKALQAQKDGALFYIEKGPHLATDISVLTAQAIGKRRLEAENDVLRRALVTRYSLDEIVGKSEAMREVFELVERVAPTRANVLLSGESGTGKERIAKIIHHHSEFSAGPFVPLNCGAIPEALIEAELFGYVKGAFTGADTNRRGQFEAADGGTIFLDEIGELPISLQPKLLRVLQERKFKPVGATHEIDSTARVIAASNRDLEQEVRAGRFREDLYFRLNVLQINLPPLRERREDIPLLAQTFLLKYAHEYKRPVRTIDPAAMERLLAFAYPGNVRQLENIIERGVALAIGDVLSPNQLPKDLSGARHDSASERRAIAVGTTIAFPEEGVDLERLVEDFEYKLIEQALAKAGGVKTRAADLLGLTFRQFRYKLAKFDQLRDKSERT